MTGGDMSGPFTHIATADAKSVTVRGRDLVNDLIGKHTFTEVFYFLVTGRMEELLGFTSETTTMDVIGALYEWPTVVRTPARQAVA